MINFCTFSNINELESSDREVSPNNTRFNVKWLVVLRKASKQCYTMVCIQRTFEEIVICIFDPTYDNIWKMLCGVHDTDSLA